MENSNILQDIIQHTRQVIKADKRRVPAAGLRRQAEASRYSGRNFAAALRSGPPAIIAEVKKASPSRGVIAQDFDAPAIARSYQSAGAAAISVLTEQKFFRGSLVYLTDISKHVTCPLLRKDFIIDAYQIYQSAVAGAGAFLLIAAALSPQQMTEFIQLGRDLGMEALVEVHNRKELEIAGQSPAAVIGVNNRNLKTFKTDISTSIELAPFFPESVVRVSESGITARQDIVRLEKAGYHAFLIGEFLMRRQDKADVIACLRGVECG